MSEPMHSPCIHVASSVCGTRQYCRLCGRELLNTEDTDIAQVPGGWVRELRPGELEFVDMDSKTPVCVDGDPGLSLGRRCFTLARSLFWEDTAEVRER